MQPELEPSPVLSGKLNHEGPTPYMFQDRMHKVLYDISLTPWIHEGFFLIHFALELSFSIQFFFRHKAGIVTLRHKGGGSGVECACGWVGRGGGGESWLC